MTDYLILFAALGSLIGGFAFALWYVDRDSPHALLDRVGAHLAHGTPLVSVSRRPALFDQDEPPDAA